MRPLFLSLFFAFLFGRAQNVQKIDGVEYNDPEGRWVSNFLEPGTDLFYGISSTGSNYNSGLAVSAFNIKDGAPVFERKIEFEKNETYLGAFHKNKKLLIFSSIKDKTSEKFYQYLRVYDDKNGEPLEKPIPLVERNYKEEPGFAQIEFIFSPDEKKFLIVVERPYKGNEGVIIARVRLFSSDDFKLIKEVNSFAEHEGSQIARFSYHLNNQGVFIMHFAYLNKKENLVDALAFISDNSKPKILEFPTENYTFISRQIDFVGDKLIFTGECLPGIDQKKSKCPLDSSKFCLLTIDPSNASILSKNFSGFPPDIASKLNYKIKDAYYMEIGFKTNKLFEHYKTLSLNGNLYTVWLHRYSYTIKSGGAETYNNRSREILVIKYKTDNTMEWMRIIPRYVASHQSPTAMYLNYTTSKNLNFIYFDNSKNLEKFPDIASYKGEDYGYTDPEKTKSIPVCASLDEKGNLTRSTLAEKADFYFSIDYTNTFVPSGPLLVCYPQSTAKGKYRFVILKF